jgi:hypothetical protein
VPRKITDELVGAGQQRGVRDEFGQQSTGCCGQLVVVAAGRPHHSAGRSSGSSPP